MPGRDHDPTKNTALGVGYWMERVLEEIDRASRDFAPDPVHDLRVALRRCRSLAQGFMVIDSDKAWKAMQEEDQRLFRRLGRLRDVQVSKEAVLLLGGPEDPVSAAMLHHLDEKEQELKQAAVKALNTFDRDKWRRRMVRLRARTQRLRPGDPVFQLIALQAWTEAHELHKQAMRNRSALAYHRLRIGIKKFRYTVENFLPSQHTEWGGDLKQVQDCLGEAQDLRVLWGTILRLQPFPDPAGKERWRAVIAEERTKRLGLYRAKMVGGSSLWPVWRQGLPPPERLRPLGLRLVEKWADFHGVDLTRARRVRRLALQLWKGLRRERPLEADDVLKRTVILHVAATLHQLGRTKRRKGSSPTGLLRGLPEPPGIPRDLLQLAACVIHFHRGSFWDFERKELAALPAEQRQLVTDMSGILRLARALARGSETAAGPLEFERTGDLVVVRIPGYSEFGPQAEKVARARCHLEYALRKPIVVRARHEGQSKDEEGGGPA